MPHREKVVVADSRFAALALLAALPDKLDVVTRLRLDAALYEPAVLAGGAIVEADAIASTATDYKPADTVGAVTVSP